MDQQQITVKPLQDAKELMHEIFLVEAAARKFTERNQTRLKVMCEHYGVDLVFDRQMYEGEDCLIVMLTHKGETYGQAYPLTIHGSYRELKEYVAIAWLDGVDKIVLAAEARAALQVAKMPQSR